MEFQLWHVGALREGLSIEGHGQGNKARAKARRAREGGGKKGAEKAGGYWRGGGASKGTVWWSYTRNSVLCCRFVGQLENPLGRGRGEWASSLMKHDEAEVEQEEEVKMSGQRETLTTCETGADRPSRKMQKHRCSGRSNHGCRMSGRADSHERRTR